VAYIHGPDGLIAMKSTNLYFTIKDRQGSIRQALDTAGTVVAGYDYLPFGGFARRYGPKPGLMRYLYTGQELDSETGLYNYRARLYDCALRRFYSPDPKRQFPSPYIYAGNNPIMMTDPTGMAAATAWDIFSDIFHFIVDAVLTLAGLAVMAVGSVFVSGPAATILGSTLLGAGIGGFAYDITTLAKGKQVSWKDWGIQLGIGAATGLLAGGFAAGAGAIVEAGTQAGITAFEVGGAARIAVNVGLGGFAGGAGSGVLGTALNAAAGHTALTGVGFSALLGGLFGALGGALSEGLAYWSCEHCQGTPRGHRL
jgi:RHS repeat-associated protein